MKSGPTLKGWIRSPRSRSAARSASVTVVLPTPLAVPATIRAFMASPVRSRAIAREQVREVSDVAGHDLADRHGHRPAKDRPVVHEGMKLAVLPARIDLRRKVAEKRAVDRPPAEPLAQLRAVDAGEIGPEAEPDEGSDELGRVPMPDREDAAHADPRQVPLAIGAEILQEDVPEGDGRDARVAVFAHRAFHQSFVLLVGAAVPRQVELVERHTDRRGLLLEKLDPHAVVADAVELAGHRREARQNLIPG